MDHQEDKLTPTTRAPWTSINLPLTTFFIGLGLIVGYKLNPLIKNGWKYKLVLIVPRTPSENFRSKISNSQLLASLCSSASILAYKNSRKHAPMANFIWSFTGQQKVVLQTKSLDDLELLAKQAQQLSVCSSLIKSKKLSVLAIGPGPSRVIDKISGKLKLF